MQSARNTGSKNLAVVLVEFQNQWTERGLFRFLVGRVMKRNGVVQNAIGLTTAARNLGVPVIHAPLVVDPSNKRGLYAHLTRGLFFRKGSRAAQLDKRVFADGDRVVNGRISFDAFDGSDLEVALREVGADRVLIAGFATDQCVSKTLKTALKKGFDAYMVADCCATFSPALQRSAEKKADGRVVHHSALAGLVNAEPKSAQQRRQTMTKNAMDVVLEWSEKYADQELESALSLVSPDAEWIVYGSEALPWAEISKGHTEILRTWSKQLDSFERETMDIETFMTEGHEIAAFGRIRDIARQTGNVAEFAFAARFLVVDGKIQKYQMYLNPDAFAKALRKSI